jgi:AraC-like DNA-binding protein
MFEDAVEGACTTGSAGDEAPWRRQTLIVSLRDARRTQMQPGTPTRAEILACDGFGYVRHGRGCCERDGSRFDVRMGDLISWRAGSAYRHGSSAASPLSLAVITFTLGCCAADAALGEAALPDRLRLPPAAGDELESRMARLAARLARREAGWIMGAGRELLDVIARVRALTAALPDDRKHWCVSRGGAAPAALTRAQAFVHEHLARRLTRDGIARAAGVHPVYLGELFRRHLGRAPLAYVRERRIAWAEALLAGGERAVAEVARAVGYEDPAHFSRVFRRSVGTPPSRFRRELAAARRV